VAAGAKILIEQAIVGIDVGALGRAQFAAIAGALDERLRALRVQTVQVAANGLARLAHRQGSRTGITARSTAATLKRNGSNSRTDDSEDSPHAHSHLLDVGQKNVGLKSMSGTPRNARRADF
jgi:hypothetical protein